MKSFTAVILTSFALCALAQARNVRHIDSLGRQIRPRRPTEAPKTLVTEPYAVGSFKQYDHSVSGKVKIMDEKTIRIKELDYDGKGSPAYFILGNSTSEDRRTPPEFLDTDESMMIVPDEIQSCERLTAYNNEHIELKIPGSKKVSDFSYLMIYSVEEGHNYGAVALPKDKYYKDGELPNSFINECSMAKAKDSSEEDAQPNRRRQPGLDDVVVDGVLGGIAAGAYLLSNAFDRYVLN